jgi:3,4-dihydroxy 2-butanone 4-phosphate synthase/GTP cyclohydrolase II
MDISQELISGGGSGVIIYLDQEGKGNGHLALMLSIPFKRSGDSQSRAYEKAGFKGDARSYRVVAQILGDLGIRSIVLLSNSEGKAQDLSRHSVQVKSVRPLIRP